MSHNLTQPEEIEIVLRNELEEYEKKIEPLSTIKNITGQDGWRATYVPPTRSECQDK